MIDRGLLDLKKQNMLDRTRTKEEKEIYNLLKVFERFQSMEEHEKLVQNIVKERNIRKKIQELMTYRKLGLRTFDDVQVRKFTQNAKRPKMLLLKDKIGKN